MTMNRQLLTVLALALGCFSAHAGLLTDDQPPAELQETAVQLPAPPAMDKLLKYDVGPTARMEFAVDPRSVSVSDGVIVRFTSVIRSPAGATNILHEGIRCDTLEKKVYATGRPDGSWATATNAAWSPVGMAGTNRYHAALAADYFCDGGLVAGSAERMVQRLRRRTPIPHPGMLR